MFIEEAREELAKIQKFFPGWEQNPLEQDGLITVRRSFHTLKGSGRMVGARDLSEFAWAIENLLNRLLDNTVTRSPQILAVLRDAVAALPSLIDQLETQRAPTGDVPGIVSARTRWHPRSHKRMRQRRHGQPPAHQQQPLQRVPLKKTVAAAPEVQAPATPSSSPPSGQAAASGRAESPAKTQLGSDDLLRDIYSRETAAHMATVRSFIDRERAKPAPHILSEEFYRACHTLAGSSKMAEARHGIRLATPLDHWLRKAFNNGAESGSRRQTSICWRTA